MERVVTNLEAMVPALLFLATGVPLAALLDRLGFFDAVATAIEARWSEVPVAALWVLAAATTAVLNLDTTVVLLTPLYLRLARRTGSDPLVLAAIPLLLASLASSFLPVSNLTTLIAAERFDVTTVDVLGHLFLPSSAACAVGWFAYRARYPTRIPTSSTERPDGRALAVGGAVVVALLVGFVAGPGLGVDPWLVALAADVVLVVVLRWVPWRSVPVATAVGVATLAAVVSLVVPADLLRGLLSVDGPVAAGAVVAGATVAANLINNLPALLVALPGADEMTWGLWAWLLGVNAGAALLPIGALANLLWWRIVRVEEVEVSLRRYVSITVPVIAPALAAAAVVLSVEVALTS